MPLIGAASATKRRFEMNSHCRLVLILGIAYSLLGLLSYTAQTKVRSADEERAAQINNRSESRSLAERSSDSNPRFNLHLNHLAAPALTEADWTRPLAISPQASTTFIVNSTRFAGHQGCTGSLGFCTQTPGPKRNLDRSANDPAGVHWRSRQWQPRNQPRETGFVT